MKKFLLLLTLIVPLLTAKAACNIDFTYTAYGDSVTFQAVNYDSTAVGEFSWDFGTGYYPTGSNAIQWFPGPGTYPVKLTFGDSTCSIIKDVIIQGCLADFDFFINGNTVDFHVMQPDTTNYSYFWDFGDSATANITSISHTYNADGSYNVTLWKTGADTCHVVKTISIVTSSDSTTCFYGFTFSISGNTVDFKPSEANSNISYLWEFGDGNSSTAIYPTHTYSAVGSYTVKLTTAGTETTCVTLNTLNIEATDSTTCFADFNFFINGNTVDFQVTQSDTANYYYDWQFGDGTWGSGEYVTHFYDSAKTYIAKLWAIQKAGDTCYAEKTFTILAPSDSNTCYTDFNFFINGNTVDFQVMDSDTTNYYYSWDFGDGTWADGVFATHFYDTARTYQVTLWKTGIDTCKTVKQFDILQPQDTTCFADFDFFVNGNTVDFKVMQADTTNYYYSWEFGDGTSGSYSNTSHTYTADGSYNVTLWKTGTDTCHVVKTISIFTPTDTTTCLTDFIFSVSGNTVSFQLTDSDSTGNSYFWEFGDGATSTQFYPIHTYNAAGTYNVSLTRSGTDTCFTSKSVTIEASVDTSTYIISGEIKASANSLDNGIVSLYEINSQITYLTKLTISQVDTGYYSFSVPMGHYLIQAVPGSNSAYFSTHEATYSGNVIDWQNGWYVSVNGHVTANIELVATATTGPENTTWNTGTDTISGSVSSGGSTLKTTAGSIENALVTLYDVNNVKLTSVYTDANGNYVFAGLEAANFTIGITFPGTTEDVVLAVSTDGDPTTDEQAPAAELQKETVVTGMSKAATFNLTLAPNPASDFINISWSGNSEAQVNVHDMRGNLVKSTTGTGSATVQTANLTPGIYLVKVKTGSTLEVKQFIKY